MLMMLPLYTYYVDSADLGYYDLSTTCITLVGTSLFLEIWTVALRHMYSGSNGGPDVDGIRSCSALFAISTFVYTAVGIVAWRLFDVRDVGFVFAFGLAGNLANYTSFLARGKGENVAFAVSGVMSTGIIIGVNVIALVFLRMPYESLYVASICGFVIQSVFLSVKLDLFPLFYSGLPSKRSLKRIFFFALPLCVNSISFWLLTSFGKVILNIAMGDSANGIYAIGSKFSVALALVTSCFTYAWQDMAFSHGVKEGSDSFYTDATFLYSIFLCVGAAILLPLIYLAFPLLVGSDYAFALDTIPMFIAVAVLSALSTFVGNIFYSVNRTKQVFYSAVLAAAVNVLLCRLFVDSFGIDGVNISICLGFAVGIVYRFILLRKPAKLRFKLQSLLGLFPLGMSFVVFIMGDWLLNLIYLSILLVAAGTVFLLYCRKRRT